MALKFGLNMKLYYAAETPTASNGQFDFATGWTLVDNHMGIKADYGTVEDDVTVAGSTFELKADVLKTGSLSFTIPYDTAKAFTQKIIDAYVNLSPLALAFADGDIATAQTRGLAGYFGIKYTMNADLKTAVKLEVTAAPTYGTDVLPYNFTISA